MTNIPIYNKDGSKKGDVALPDVFNAPLRTDLIRKAVHVAQNNRRQAYGTDPRAGKKKSVESWGPGQGVSRVPRLRGSRQAAFMPGAVGGRRAHPPKSERIWARRINKKEKVLAMEAALAGVANLDLVNARGHLVPEGKAVPFVVEDAFADIDGTANLLAALGKLGLGDDVQKAKDSVKVRAGKGKRRGRKHKGRLSILIVTHNDADVYAAARNLPGVQVTKLAYLNVEGLAPGGDPGRLTVFTESAMKALNEQEVAA